MLNVNQEKPKIILEDKFLLVIDKPSGWVVNSAVSTRGQRTIQDWIAENFNFSISNSEVFRNGIVHRLDKETSGVLLVAKDEDSFYYLQKQFKDRLVEKTYLAMVHGRFDDKEGSISIPLGRLSWNREKFGVVPGGKSAQTNFAVEGEYRGPKEIYTLLRVSPKTGRTHQIRVHMKHLDHPVISDQKYAGRKRARADRSWCPRLFLHAYKLVFRHPVTHQKASVTAPLSDDLKSVMTGLVKT